MSATSPLKERLRTFVGKEIGPPETARDAVNEAMIRQWCDAHRRRQPRVYRRRRGPEVRARRHRGPTDDAAGVDPARHRDGQTDATSSVRTSRKSCTNCSATHGYTAVVATDCEQKYTRYLSPAIRCRRPTVIESISDEKATGLGIGYFIDTRTTFRDQARRDGRLDALPGAQVQAGAATRAGCRRRTAPAKPTRMRPPLGFDNKWWWDAVQNGQLPIQRCKACAMLRHPPRPDVRQVPVDRVGLRSRPAARARSTATSCCTTRSSPATSTRWWRR